MKGDCSAEKVAAISAWDSPQVTDCLRRARAGDLESLADFVTHALIKRHKDVGYTDEQAVFAAKNLIDAVEIKVRLS